MSETEVRRLRDRLRTRIIAFNIALQDFIEAVNSYMMAVDRLLEERQKSSQEASK